MVRLTGFRGDLLAVLAKIGHQALIISDFTVSSYIYAVCTEGGICGFSGLIVVQIGNDRCVCGTFRGVGVRAFSGWALNEM